MLWIAKERGWHAPYISQHMYNLLARGIEQEYLPMCKEFGVSTVVYNPLAGGLLTGKHKQEKVIPGTRFDNNQMYQDRYWHEQYFQAVEQVRKIAQVGGTLARQSGIELAAASHGERLHHPGRFAAGAARGEPGDGQRWSAERGNAEGVRRSLAKSARTAAGLQPVERGCQLSVVSAAAHME